VGPAAQGFSVHTPLATIVDLGTEFGLKVAGDGKEEAHVFQGEVEIETDSNATTAERPSRRVGTGQARRILLEADGKTVRTKPITPAPDRFVRRVPAESNIGLPEPRIVFSHQGDRNPTVEGWSFLWEPKAAKKLEGVDMKPVTDNGVAAWAIDDRSRKMGVTYRMIERQGMNQQMVAKGRSCGWVLRVRVKLTATPQPCRGFSFFSFWDGGRAWRFHPTVDQQGNQGLFVYAKTSLGENVTINVPNSRDRYVDYEVRYHPETKDADLYVDGRLAATKVYVLQRSRLSLHFGTLDSMKSDTRFARVEWGLFDNAPPIEKKSEKKDAEKTP
jgi:hypothetical protein